MNLGEGRGPKDLLDFYGSASFMLSLAKLDFRFEKIGITKVEKKHVQQLLVTFLTKTYFSECVLVVWVILVSTTYFFADSRARKGALFQKSNFWRTSDMQIFKKTISL